MRLETPGAHGDADPRVGLGGELVGEAVALGAEREQCARGQLRGVERLALGVDREQRPVERGKLRGWREEAGPGLEREAGRDWASRDG